uniref:Uncharacterized protein n=1 Tax=Anguilla anguilla TaxID=7936 RepID=A0A0E9VJ35_ANGAN
MTTGRVALKDNCTSQSLCKREYCPEHSFSETFSVAF